VPTLSSYFFADTNLRGPADYVHTPAQGLTRTTRLDMQGKRSNLTILRSDDEEVIDLAAVANSDAVRGIVSGLLTESAALTSPIRVGWRPYQHVEYFDQAPGGHAPDELLLRVFFDIHVSTPGWCLAVDQSLSFYIYVFLDGSHRIRANVEGWAFQTSYGSACRDGVRDELRKRMPGAVAALQQLVDPVIGGYADRPFSAVYLLPGAGERSGYGLTNPDEYASIAVVPRISIAILAARYWGGQP
jgi:hypothetical protein